jgi:hypothetical protein
MQQVKSRYDASAAFDQRQHYKAKATPVAWCGALRDWIPPPPKKMNKGKWA